MAAAASVQDLSAETDSKHQSTRETVESVVVAFILAFLFRAFVAEAFVIPTGSMAPTLMGAHKDLYCEHCGEQYQASASQEFDSNTGAPTGYKTVASTCATCRGLNAYDFRGNKNHATFSGDRILVSKFDYVLSSPSRWDVLVFKFPLGARMNYIKRLIGLPGESLLVSDGDVYTKKDAQNAWVIARKPPHKIQAMKQMVTDTEHQANILIRQGWPSLWQPWSEAVPSTHWTLEQSADSWSAKLTASENPQWLRYYHKFVDVDTWNSVLDGNSLPAVEPTSSQLVTDYLAYNSSYSVDASVAFELRDSFPLSFSRRGTGQRWPKWVPLPEVTEQHRALDVAKDSGTLIREGNGENNDGVHWVGDLSAKFVVDVQSATGSVMFDLVEFGVHFTCSVDLATGNAKLQALDAGQPLQAFAGKTEVVGQTSMRGKGSYEVELANFDDQIVLWVNGSVVKFDQPAEFDSRQFRNGTTRRPHWTAADPLDAAPAGVGGSGVDLTVQRATVFRDIYYIAVQDDYYSDFQLSQRNFRELAEAVPDTTTRAGLRTCEQAISAVYSNPQWWETTNLFEQRGTREFKLEEGQYFPMGDNSAASSDARAWVGHNYVEERYLLGKALLVFWPHSWKTPLPMTPNLARMGLIR